MGIQEGKGGMECPYQAMQLVCHGRRRHVPIVSDERPREVVVLLGVLDVEVAQTGCMTAVNIGDCYPECAGKKEVGEGEGEGLRGTMSNHFCFTWGLKNSDVLSGMKMGSGLKVLICCATDDRLRVSDPCARRTLTFFPPPAPRGPTYTAVRNPSHPRFPRASAAPAPAPAGAGPGPIAARRGARR